MPVASNTSSQLQQQLLGAAVAATSCPFTFSLLSLPPHLLILCLDQVSNHHSSLGGKQERGNHAHAEDEHNLEELVTCDSHHGGNRANLSTQGQVQEPQ